MAEGLIHGFKLVRSKEFPQYHATAQLYVHQKHGCEFLNIVTEDINNTFAITVKTLCYDDSGSTHVLEHMVLHGSAKYPINDVFNELNNRSIASYMNASTYFNWTQYPFTTQSEKDFHNILDVYMDAVFHPNLEENNFLVECHHLEPTDLEDINSPLTHCGVVYNEMAGDLSSEGEFYDEKLRAALLPDTPYKYVFGGEPSSIAKMTLDELKKQHQRYYAPSNSLFYHYGSFDIHKIFEHVDRFLSEIDYAKIDFPDNSLLQPLWTEPKRVEIDGPMGTMGDDTKKIRSSVKWVIGDSTKQDSLYYDLYIIYSLLCGSVASILYQKLIKSQIALSFLNCGPDSSLKNLTFEISVEGLTEENIDVFFNIVMDSLKDVVKNGFNEEMIASALHSNEISQLKVSGNIGKMIMNSMTSEWVLGLDPFVVMDIKTELEKLRARIASKPRYLEEIVEKYLLNNMSRLHFVMRPVKNFVEDKNKEIQKELENYQNSLSESDKKAICEKAKDLKSHVESDKPLHLLPSIKSADISKVVPPTPIEKTGNIAFVEAPTNGIVYGKLRCEVNLNDPLIKDTDIFVNCIAAIGAGELDDEQFSVQEDLYTGGIIPSSTVSFDVHSKDETPKLYIILSFSCLERNITKMCELLRKVVFEPKLDNKDQIIALTNMLANDYSDDLMSGGLEYSVMHAGSRLRRASAIQELISGTTFLKRVMALTEDEENHNEILGIVADYYEAIFRTGRFDACINGEKRIKDEITKQISAIVDELNEGTDAEALDSDEKYDLIDEFIEQNRESMNNFLEIDASTNYTSIVRKAPFGNNELNFGCLILSSLLEHEIFYEDVRQKLNSYGAYSTYYADKGIFVLSSYRDSNCQGVIKAATDCLQKVADGEITDEMVDRAIVQTFAFLDKPAAPRQIGQSMFMSNLSNEEKAKRRLKLLSVKKEDLIEAAKYLLKQETAVTIVGNESVSEPPEDFDVERLADYNCDNNADTTD